MDTQQMFSLKGPHGSCLQVVRAVSGRMIASEGFCCARGARQCIWRARPRPGDQTGAQALSELGTLRFAASRRVHHGRREVAGPMLMRRTKASWTSLVNNAGAASGRAL